MIATKLDTENYWIITSNFTCVQISLMYIQSMQYKKNSAKCNLMQQMWKLIHKKRESKELLENDKCH